MGQQEYENFKQRLREWMENHPDEYARFEDAMNSKDDSGYRKILFEAVRLVPQYKKLLRKKANEGLYDNVDEIEQVCTKHGLAEKLIREVDNANSKSIIPAMLCWFYFGESFERMVERGEEIRRSPNIGYLEKMTIAATIKLAISYSIKLGLRTRQDWITHREAMRLAESDKVLDWAIEDENPVSDEKKKAGRPSTAMPLREMFSHTVTDPEALIEKLSNYLTVKHSQSDIARLKIALDELHFLISPITIKSFRDALSEQFSPGIHIVHERGVQEAYSRIIDSFSEDTMSGGMNDEYWNVKELKKNLSD